MRIKKIRLAAIVFATLLSQGASVATIVNGSFELTEPAGSFDTLGMGSMALAGWTIGSGSVDFIGDY